MSAGRPTTIERAFELARAGRCRSVLELRQALAREGYSDARAQLDGRSLREQLNQLMAAAAGDRRTE